MSIIREFQKKDKKAVDNIFAIYWNDPEFLIELSCELDFFVSATSQRESKFLIAEENEKIVGIAGTKKIPEYLKTYAKTEKPIELYVVAVKYKRKGIGQALESQITAEAKKSDYSEILLFSPNTHKESWNFYEKLGYKKAGEVTPPDDEKGQVWRKAL